VALAGLHRGQTKELKGQHAYKKNKTRATKTKLRAQSGTCHEPVYAKPAGNVNVPTPSISPRKNPPSYLNRMRHARPRKIIAIKGFTLLAEMQMGDLRSGIGESDRAQAVLLTPVELALVHRAVWVAQGALAVLLAVQEVALVLAAALEREAPAAMRQAFHEGPYILRPVGIHHLSEDQDAVRAAVHTFPLDLFLKKRNQAGNTGMELVAFQ
jgi:hypothetical protein